MTYNEQILYKIKVSMSNLKIARLRNLLIVILEKKLSVNIYRKFLVLAKVDSLL